MDLFGSKSFPDADPSDPTQKQKTDPTQKGKTDPQNSRLMACSPLPNCFSNYIIADFFERSYFNRGDPSFFDVWEKWLSPKGNLFDVRISGDCFCDADVGRESGSRFRFRW